MAPAAVRPLVDGFGRHVSYLRISVTDRCDFRCTYCMSERMEFVPRADILSLEEVERIAAAFIRRGTRRIRLTGGEPLVRRGIDTLVQALGRYIHADGLDELTLTTNGSQLARHAETLATAGVRRVNVSLDSLDAGRFARITRRGRLADVLAGIEAATSAGLVIKINMVALKGVNEDEVIPMMRWAHGRGHGLTLIETMPMGDTGEDRLDRYMPLTEIRERLDRAFHLLPVAERSGGPARYYQVNETGGRIGFISPLTRNFCDGCNRVRLTATGRLYLCLGQEDRIDLKAVLRDGGTDADIDAALDEGMRIKPRGHDFRIDRHGQAPAVPRTMSATGG